MSFTARKYKVRSIRQALRNAMGPLVRLITALVLVLGSAWPLAAADDDLSGVDYGLDAAIAQADRDLDLVTAPRISALGTAFADANDITFRAGGVEAAAHLLPGLPMKTQVTWGFIEQDATSFREKTDYDRLAAIVSVGDVYITPSVALFGRASFEGFDDFDSNLWGGRAGIKGFFLNGSEAGAWVGRETFWADHDRRNPRTFNRLVDLSQLDRPAFRLDRIAGWTQLVLSSRHTWRLDGGYDDYEDGNHRAWAYTHYQIELPGSREGRWTAIKPNAYVEFVGREDPAYFSPSYHLTLGTMLHTIRQYNAWTLEGEVNPQVLITEGDTDFGGHVAGDVVYTFGRLSVGAGGFFFGETDGYWLWRTLAKITLRF